MLMTILVIMTNTMAQSEENKYPMCSDKTDFFEKTWCETVEFQKSNYAEGKEQIKKLPSDIAAVPGTIKTDVTKLFTSIGNGVTTLVTSISNGVTNVTQSK